MKSSTNLPATISSENNRTWPSSETLRWLIVFSQFTFQGPPVGCIAFLAFIPIYHVLAVFTFRTFGIFVEPEFYNNYVREGFVNGIKTLPLILIVGFFASYTLGGIQAAITGVISATWNLRFKTLPLWVPLIASILPISIYLILYPQELAGSGQMGETTKIPYLLILVGFTHLSAASVCWFKARRFFYRSIKPK